MAETRQLDAWDYVTLSTMIILSSVVGLYHVFKASKSSQKDASDFVIRSKELGLFPLIMSAMGTFCSSIGMLGFPVEFYMNGLVFGLIMIAILIHIPIAVFLYLPVFFRLNRNTVYEYLELRFCKPLRIFTSLLLTLQTTLYTAVVMYAPAVAINQVTGLHLWASVVSVGIICIIYTSMGGIKAVVWADVTQTLVMVAVLLIILIKEILEIGGLNKLWGILAEGQRAQIPLKSSPYTQYTAWTMLIANPIHLIGVVTVNQQLMQRYLSNTTMRRSRLCFIGGCGGICCSQIMVVLAGAVLYARYHNCDPLLSGQIKVRDQQMALFAMESLAVFKGLPGVFVAGVMCATLSTLSSTLNTLSAVTISDYVKPLKPDISELSLLRLSKVLVFVFGLVCIGLVALTENIGGVVKATFGISGIIGGPTVTIFTLGMLLPWVNSKGATVGFVCSMVLPLWAWIGSLMNPLVHLHAPLSVDGCLNMTLTNLTTTWAPVHQESLLDQFYSIHSFWYTSWSLSVGISTALLYTFITGVQDPKTVDPDLLFSFMRKYGSKQPHYTKVEKEKSSVANGFAEQPLMLFNGAADLPVY